MPNLTSDRYERTVNSARLDAKDLRRLIYLRSVAYHMLKHGLRYRELGADHFSSRDRSHKNNLEANAQICLLEAVRLSNSNSTS